MYSNRSSKVRKKSSIPLPQDSGQKMVYSALGILNSSLPGGTMCHDLMESNMPSSEDGGFPGHENITGGRHMMYGASGTVLNGSHAGGKICHRGIEGDVQSSEDSGFREHDNMSQNSTESGSYVDGNLVKTGSFENVAHLSQTAEDVRSQLRESLGNNEEALKGELLHIFEMYFKSKMEERLRGLRSRQMEWEETSRAEKEELGNKIAKEKMEMQKHFADAISKLTHSFNEERKQLEHCYEEQLKDLREMEQKRTDGKFAKEKIELKEKLEAEYQVMLMKEMSQEKQELLREKSEIKARFNKEKFELEKNFNCLLTEAETSLQRVRNELKESMRMQKESQVKIVDLEAKLKEEKRQRVDMESELEQEKVKYSNEETLKKKENEQLRSEVDVLRQEIEEKRSEIKRLLEANQESNLKMRALTRHLQKRAKRSSEEMSVKSQESEARESEGRASAEDRPSTSQANAWDLQRNLTGLDTRTEKTIKVFDSKMRLIDERRRILVFVTFEKQAVRGFYRFLNALLPKQPISSTVRVLMTSDSKDEEVFSEH